MHSELQSLRQQITETDINLRLIQERKAAFVLSTDIPLQLIKEEQELQIRRNILKERIVALEQVESEQHIAHTPASSKDQHIDNPASNHGVQGQFYGPVTINNSSASTPTAPDQSTSVPVFIPRHDWDEVPAVDEFYGRSDELAQLERWISTDRCRLITILGIGGMGKTALAACIAQQVAHQFVYIMWRSLLNAPPLNDLLGQCIVFFSGQQQTDLPDDSRERIRILLRYLKQQRCLLVLDNVETILQDGQAAGAYRAGYEGYGDLILRVGGADHHSLLLLTSREKPQDLAKLEGKRVRTLTLSGMSIQESQAILQDHKLKGSEPAWEELVQRFSGNPLALKLTAEPICNLCSGSIDQFLQGGKGKTTLRSVHDILEQQFHRLSPLEAELMYWLAIEREPITMDDLHDALVSRPSRGEMQEALGDLRRRSLIECNEAEPTLQNVVMEYVTERLTDMVCAEIMSGSVYLLNSHALIKAQAKEYVRNSQMRLILDEVLDKLERQVGSREAVVERLTEVLTRLRENVQDASNFYTTHDI
jgi:hypothetical protein